MEQAIQIEILKKDFQDIQPILQVIGDETRQLILLVLMEASCKVGMRVGEITERTHLSRPAVSHQLRILKDSGLVHMREEGTKNYYFISVSENRHQFCKLQKLLTDLGTLMDGLEEG